MAWWRLGRYPSLPGWQGSALAAREVHVLKAAAEAVLAPVATDLDQWAKIVDAYVAELPSRVRIDVHAAIFALEQAPLKTGRWQRFSEAPLAARQAVLRDLEAGGGDLQQIVQAVRDLAHLGAYAQPASWVDLGYGGPWVAPTPRPRRPAWAALVAPAGRRPKAAP